MTKKVIDDSNLGHLVSKAKAAFWPKEDVINVNLADVATSGDYNDLSNKPTIPDVSNFITNSVNNLTNYYLKSETYTKEEVAALIGAIQQFHYEIAASTSAVTSPANNVLYLIGPTGSGADKYEEYVYDATKPVAERWIKIGDTSIDLSGYVTTQALNTALASYTTSSDLTTLLAGKQDKIDASNKLDYSLLENTPTIPAAPVNADWNATEGLAKILNKPTIPTQYAGSPTAGGPANMTVSIPFAKPDDTSTSTVYTVQVPGITELRDGVCFYLMNNKVSSASGFTIDVNDLGAKRVYLTTAAATRATTQMTKDYTWLLVYNETRYSSGCWDLVYTFNSNTTYTINYLLDGSPWYVQHTLYRYQLMFQVDEKTVTPFNANSNTTGTTKTIHTDYEFDPFGKIFYYSTTSTVSANTTVGATYCAFVRAAVDLRYTFNVSTSVNPLSLDYSPVYLKININSTTGMATLNSNLPLTQTLPTTNDGIYYLYLGRSTTTKYTCSLEAHHPIYYHNGTTLCELLPKETLAGIENNLNFVTIPDYEEAQLVTAAALNDLNDRTQELETDIATIDKVTASSLNDLNDRMLEAEKTALTSQRIFIGDATTEIDTSSDDEAWQNYIDHCDPDPQEGDILIPYNTKTGFIADSKEAIVYDSFDDYSEQGWPSASANFICYSFNVDPHFWGTLELVTSTPGTYRVYSYLENWSYYTEATEITIGSEDITSDGLYRKKFEGSVDENSNLYIYYTGNEPNIDIYRYLPDSEPLEFYSPGGGWIEREKIAKKASEYISRNDSMYDDANAYPSNHTVISTLKKYPKVSSSIENYDSVKDKYICFSWIEYISQQNNSQGVSIYLRCSTSSTTPKTVQVSGSGYSGWTDKTPDTLDENGCYYVLLGTLTTSNHNLYVKGNNTSYGDSLDYCYFDISGPCYLYGDMISLVGGHTGGSDNNDISDEVYAQSYTFPHMFKNQTNIFSHPTCRLYMITKRISSSGYHYTFEGCENMIVSPIISGSPKGSYALNGIFYRCYNMKASLCNVSALIDRTWYPWLPSGACQTDGHVIYNPGGSYYSNYDIPVKTNDTYYGLFTDIINSENTILFNKVSSLVSNNSSLLSNSMLPNKIYEFGTLASSKVFSLSTIKRPGISHYFWTFETGDTAPTITWPDGLTWPGGLPPAILANKHYEISVLNNIVAWMEV